MSPWGALTSFCPYSIIAAMKSRSIFKNQWFWISLAIVAYLLAFATYQIATIGGL